MEKQLRNAFLELKSAENSISVLREDLKCNTVGLTADHHGNPRKRNFVQEENDKLRGRQVRNKNLPNKIPTLVNGSTSTRVNTTRTCHNLKAMPKKM